MKKINSAALIGLGAIGSFLAPRLFNSLDPGCFKIIASGERKKRLSNYGTIINDTCYDFPVFDPDSDHSDPVDLIIVAVKHTQLDQALTDIKGLVGTNTLILPLLNGIDSEEKTAKIYGWDRVLYGFMRVSVVMKNHQTSYDPQKGAVYFGEADNKVLTDRTKMIQALFHLADIPYKTPDDMIHAMWFKFMANIGENLTCALLGIPFGGFHVSDHANAIREMAMQEVIAIANHRGIMLGEKELLLQKQAIDKLPYHNQPSTLQDLENKRPTEIEMFAGMVVQLGRECSIPTPVNELFYHGIKVLEEKNKGII